MAATFKTIKVTIPSGSDTSNTANISKGLLTGIRFPATMTSTTFSIQNSTKRTDGTFRDWQDTTGGKPLDGLSIDSSDDLYLNTAQTAGLGFVQIVTDSNEGADREIILMYKDAA